MASPLDIWRQLGIREGGRYFVHSNLAFFFDEENVRNPAAVLESLLNLVGAEGSVVLPAFTYSKHPGGTFDPNSDSGLDKMGALSTTGFHFGFKRTNDPMFSVLHQTESSLDLQPSANKSFGNGSTFSRLVDLDYDIISLGVGAGATLLHELERRLHVTYRSDIWIAVNVKLRDKTTSLPWRIYARDLRNDASRPDFSKLTHDARNLPFVVTTRGRRGLGYRYRISDMLEYLQRKLRASPEFLIRGGRE